MTSPSYVSAPTEYLDVLDRLPSELSGLWLHEWEPQSLTLVLWVGSKDREVYVQSPTDNRVANRGAQWSIMREGSDEYGVETWHDDAAKAARGLERVIRDICLRDGDLQ